MSCYTTDDTRITIKYSTIAGQEPTIPLSDDHTDGTWLPTDLYIGELFMNSVDNLVWIRTDNGIVPIGATGGTTSFIGDYVNISGGTFSGPVHAPTFSATGITASYIIADTFQGGTFNGTFIGDGSGLTGINANWLGGTVSNPVYFENIVYLDNDIKLNGPITTDGTCIDFQSDICVTGGISASYFIGDGSGLTNIPLGTQSDTYTETAALSGNSIIFTRNDTATYDVDLTPLLATQSIGLIAWDEITNTLNIEFVGGDVISTVIDTFTNISSLTSVNAPEFYGGVFYGEFVGTFSNDIYSTTASLIGTELVIERNDGVTFSADLSSLAGGGTGGCCTLQDTLTTGNTTGPNWIDVEQNYGLSNTFDAGFVINNHYLTFDADGVEMLATNDLTLTQASIRANNNGSIYLRAEAPSSFNFYDAMYINGVMGWQGLQYDADYSATYTNRSLVDKEYVDNYAPTLQQVLNAGYYTGANSIQVQESYNVFSTYTWDGYNIDHTIKFGDGGGNMWLMTYDQNMFLESRINLNQSGYVGIIAEGSMGITTPAFTITGQGVFEGVKYAADYSADFSSRSLVDREYVDLAVGNITGGSVISSDIGTAETPSPFGGQYLLAYKPSTGEVNKFDIDDFLPTRNTSTSLTAGTHTLLTQIVYDNTMDFFEWKYIATTGPGVKRAGTIMAVMDSALVNFSDDGPMSFGDTSGLTFDVVRSGINIELRAVITSGTWNIISHATPWRSGVVE